MSTEVGLGLGSNIGDKAAHIRAAVHALRCSDAVRNLRVSSLYRTAPWGYELQDWFVNACAVGETDQTPRDLLALCHRIEAQLGRERVVRWGPRTMDIDLLYYGALACDDADLRLPHAELLNRAFVLVPLAELKPHLIIDGVPLQTALRRLDATDVIRLDGDGEDRAAET